MHTTNLCRESRNKDSEETLEGETSVKPLATIYWSRVVLGIIAALICVSLNILTTVELFTGLALAILFYILTYYIIYKRMFMDKVEKPTKVLTTGIGGYFFTWIVTWVLFYTFWLWYTGQIPPSA